jgi:hypothetical protein
MANSPAMAALMSLQRQKARPRYDVQAGQPTTDVQIGAPKDMTPQYEVTAGEPQIEPQRPSPAALAALQANDDHIRQSIAAKLQRSPVLGTVPEDSGLLTMAQLAHLNLPAGPNADGIPVGLNPDSLNDLERRWITRRR